MRITTADELAEVNEPAKSLAWSIAREVVILALIGVASFFMSTLTFAATHPRTALACCSAEARH